MQLSSINFTALWTASIRAQEHSRENSLVNDPYASKFLESADLESLNNFKGLEKPRKSIISRYHYIDNYLSNHLQLYKQQSIVSLGCGFDCRPYRLAHGNWYEIDQEPIIRLKESILPVSQCHNPLERIIGNITSVGFKEVLRSLPLNNPIFVIEGVLNYLDENEVQDLLITIKMEYPNCTIICDLMSKLFYSKYAKDFVSALASVDLSYRFLRNDYAHYLQNVGYSTVEALSILDLSIKAGLFSVPKVFRKLFLRKLAEGYTLYILKPND